MWDAVMVIALMLNTIVIVKLATSIVALRERMRTVEKACGVDFWNRLPK